MVLGVRGLAAGEEGGQRLGIRLRGQGFTQLRGQGDDAVPAPGRPHHAPQRGHAPALQEAGHGHVGRDHEVLDDVARAVVNRDLEVDHLAARDHRPRLDRLEIEQAVAAAEGAQPLGRFVLQTDLFLEAGHRGHFRGNRRSAFEPRAHRVVGELRAAMDQGAMDIVADDRSRGADVHLDHDRPAVLARVQRREIGGEALREHGEDERPRIDGSRAVAGMAVRGRVLAHHLVHVGDGDEEPDVIVGQALRHLDLVEVAGLAVVDRGPGEGAQVADARGRRLLQGLHFAVDLGGEVGDETVLLHGPPGRGTEVEAHFKDARTKRRGGGRFESATPAARPSGARCRAGRRGRRRRGGRRARRAPSAPGARDPRAGGDPTCRGPGASRAGCG